MKPLRERILLTVEGAQLVLPALTTAAIVVAPAPMIADRLTAQPGHSVTFELPATLDQHGATGAHGELNRGHPEPFEFAYTELRARQLASSPLHFGVQPGYSSRRNAS